MRYISTRTMLLYGQRYDLGDSVPVESLKPGQIKKLVDFKRIIAMPDTPAPALTPEPAPKRRGPRNVRHERRA